MARLIIAVDVDLDPTLEDPHEVANEILADDFETDSYNNVPVDFVKAEWSVSESQ